MPRLALVLLGTAGVTAGVIAVFVPDTSESGGVALIVGGVVLLLIGVIGLSPLRISGKEWSVDFFEGVAEAIDSAPTLVKQEIADKLFMEASSSGLDATSRLAGAVQSSIAFQNHAVNLILREFGRVSNNDFQYEMSTDFDAVISFQGRLIAVEVKKTLTQSSLDAVRQRVPKGPSTVDFAGLIVIVQDEDSPRRYSRSSDVDEGLWLVSESNLDLLPKTLLRWGFDITWA